MKQEIKIKGSWLLMGVIAMIAAGGVLVFTAKAQEANITFPIAELGGCESKAACHEYCEEEGNMDACLNYAEQNNLMPREEIAQARKFIAAGSKGPGGCDSKNSCEAFCNSTSNMKECVAFAEQNGMMSQEELKEAKQVMQALEAGATLPGGCTDKASCDSYCNSSNPANMLECIKFGVAAGFVPQEEADKILAALEKGIAPPKCRGDEACADYCAKNIDECANFMLASGMKTAEEVERFRKTKGMGPGNCRGRECETFCNDPANQDTCRAFAEENGLLPPEDAGRREEGRRQMESAFSQMPPEVARCVKDALGADRFDQISSGQVNPGDMSGIMDNCFRQMPKGEDRGGSASPAAGLPASGGPPPQGDSTGSFPRDGGEYREYNGERREFPEMIGPPIEGQEGRRPPEGYMRPEQIEQYQNQIPGEYSKQDRQFQEGATLEGFQQQFQEQYREQVEQQINTQIQQTFEQQYPEQYQQQYQPSGEYQAPPQGESATPPAESMPPPPPAETAPTSYRYSSENGLASLLQIFFGLFR